MSAKPSFLQISKFISFFFLIVKIDFEHFSIAYFRFGLSKLPDKGERIKKLYEKIVKEIESRNDIDRAAEMFSDLNLVEKGIKTVTHMEWNGGKVDGDQILVAADTLDSDDDDETNIDPLKIIAQSRETKLVKIVKPVKSLITQADLDDIKSMTENGESSNISFRSGSDNLNVSQSSMELEPHAINLIKRENELHAKEGNAKSRFLPHKTTKSDVHSVEHEKNRKHGKHWEITAATPPLIRNNAVKLISLQESIEMERQHQEKLREQIEKQAEERLAIRKKLIAENISLLPAGSTLTDPNAFFQSYRQREEKFNELDESEDEAYSENSDDGEEPDTHGISVVLCDQ